MTTRRLRAALLTSSALALAWMLPATGPARAQDATWQTNPGSGDFYDPNNWIPGSVPTGTATFGTSNTTTLTLGSSGSFGGWTFNAGASTYTFDLRVGQVFTGAGIVINGGSATINNLFTTLDFRNASTAGSATINNSGILTFADSSNAGTATITNNVNYLRFLSSSTAGSAAITNNSVLSFSDTSSAGSATITGNGDLHFYDTSSAGSAAITSSNLIELGGASTAGSATITSVGTLRLTQTSTAGIATITIGGIMELRDASTAGSASITNNGRGWLYDTSTAGNANITNNGGVNFFDTSTAGNAAITNNNALQFYGSSTAGSATITNNDSLSFYDTSTAGNANITNLGTLTFNQTSNAGTATLTNGSFMEFGGASTAGSDSITNNATLNFSDTSSAGSAAITNFGTLKFNQTSTAGSATIANNNVLELHETSTAGSATITSNAYLDFYNASTAGSATITSSGNLNFHDTSTAGNAVIANTDTAEFRDASTAGSATITNSGFLGFYNLSTAGSAAITNNGGMSFHDASTAGSATITSSGTLNFLGTSTAGNATLINGGLLDFRNTSTAGSANISNYANLVFENSSTAGSATITNNGFLNFLDTSTAGSATITNSRILYFFGNSTAGNAALINNAGRTVDFSNSTGPNGDGKLSAGSIAGAGDYILGANELTVGSNNLSTEVSGGIAGIGGSLVKTGTGTLTLWGINTYTGATIVNGGTLEVNGSIASSGSLTVNAGGTLGGTGIVGNTTIASGGTLAPGKSVGTLTVSGNLAFSAGSFYRVEVSATSADRTNVSGNATLTGGTVQAGVIADSFRSQTYTILNATGGLGGTRFSGLNVTGSFSPARNPHLAYDLNNVYLVLDPGAIVLPAGTGANQTSVAGAINGAAASGGTPPAGFDALLNMGQPQLNHGLRQVSGQPGAATTQASFNAMQQFVGMLDPVGGGADGERGATAGDSGTLGYASTAPNDAKVREAYAAVTPRAASGGDVIDHRWGVWASGYGGGSNLNGNSAAGSSSTTSRIYGTVVGADYRLSPDTLVGFALGGAGFNFSVADALGGGRADVFQAGLYARHNLGPAYLSAALAYGWQDVTTDRTVTVSGTDRLTANFKASTFAGRLETGWRFAPIPASSFGVTPYAAAQVTTFHLPGYGETALVGSNQFALSYGSQDTTNVRTELGTRTDQSFLVDNGLLTLRGRLAWAHDTNTNRFVSAAFQTLPGAAFTVSSARPAADSALVGGRAEMKWRNGLSLAGTIEGEFSRSTQTYAGKGTVRYEW